MCTEEEFENKLQTIFVKADPSRIISRAEVLSPGNVEEIHQVYDELCTNKLKYKKPAAKIFRWVMRFIRRDFQQHHPEVAIKPRPTWTYWPNGIVYYEFGDGAGERCWSYVGMSTSSSQQLNLQSSGCWLKGTVIHEILHAVGFLHEHQRFDRDDFITVYDPNIDPGSTGQFSKVSLSISNNVNSPYDIDSIMHYGSYSFGQRSGNSLLQTIFVKNDSNRLITEPYARPYLSPVDAAEINTVYSSTCTNISVECPSIAVLAPDPTTPPAATKKA
ncbi:unnamed protein product, partial [Notodromas monacha]